MFPGQIADIVEAVLSQNFRGQVTAQADAAINHGFFVGVQFFQFIPKFVQRNEAGFGQMAGILILPAF